MPSGIAVSASPKLWIRSARSATEPESAKIASCAAAAIAEDDQADRDGLDAFVRPDDRAVYESVRVAVLAVRWSCRDRAVLGMRVVVVVPRDRDRSTGCDRRSRQRCRCGRAYGWTVDEPAVSVKRLLSRVIAGLAANNSPDATAGSLRAPCRGLRRRSW